MAEELYGAGVEVVAGFPADTPSLTDAAARHPGLTAVVPRDQRMLGCTAAGYAHAARRPLAIEVSSGPSFMNAMAGLNELASLRRPAVLVTTAVAADRQGRGAFQEVDQAAVLGDLAVWRCTVRSPGALPRAIRSAVWTAQGAGKGIALVEVADEALLGSVPPSDGGTREPPSARHPALTVPAGTDVDRAVSLVRGSERPLVLVGGGAHAAQAGPAVRALARLLQAPVVSTASGRGTVPEDDEAFCGLVGLYRSEPAAVLDRADLVIVVGSRLEETACEGWPALASIPVLRIDEDARAENFGPESACFLLGDARLTVERLTAAVRSAGSAPADRPGWETERLRSRAALERSVLGDGVAGRPVPALPSVPRTLRILSRVFAEARYCVVQENGLHDLWGYHFPYLDLGGTGSALTPGEQTMMGFAVPAALGVHLADPGIDLVVTCGDGALEASFAALATARARRTGMTVVTWDNGGWGWPRSGRTETRDLMSFAPESQTLPVLQQLFSFVSRPSGATETEGALRKARDIARNGELALVVVAADDVDLPPCARHAAAGEPA